MVFLCVKQLAHYYNRSYWDICFVQFNLNRKLCAAGDYFLRFQL
jgi:hypothetical protein